MPTKKLLKNGRGGGGVVSASPPESAVDSSEASGEKADYSDVDEGAISSGSNEEMALMGDDEKIRLRIDLYSKDSIELFFPIVKGCGKRNPPVAVRGCSKDYKVVFQKIREWRQMTEEQQEDRNLTHSKKERDRRFFRDNIWNFTQTATKLRGVSIKVEKSEENKVDAVIVEEKEEPILTKPKETDVREKKATKQPSPPKENSNDGEKKATIPVAPVAIAPAIKPPKMAIPAGKNPSAGPAIVPKPNVAVPNVAVPNVQPPMAAGGIRSPMPQTVQGTFPLIWARTVLDPVSGTHTIIVPPQQFPGIRQMPPLIPMPTNSPIPPLSYQILLSPHPNPMAAMAAMGVKPIEQNLAQQQNQENALNLNKDQQRIRNEQILQQQKGQKHTQKQQHQMLQQQQLLQQMNFHQMNRNNLQKGQQYQALQQQQQQQQKYQLAQQQKGQESSVNQQKGQQKQQQGKEPNLNQHHMLQLQQQQQILQQQQGLQPQPNVNQQNLQQPKKNQENTQQQNMLPPQQLMHLQHLQRMQNQKEQQQTMTEQQKLIRFQQQQRFFHQHFLHQQNMEQQLPQGQPPTVVDASSNVRQLPSVLSPSISPILTPTIESTSKKSTVAKVDNDSGASNKSKPVKSKTPVTKVVKGGKAEKAKPTVLKEVNGGKVSKLTKKTQAPIPDKTSTEAKSRRGKPVVPTVKRKETVQASPPTRSRKRKPASPSPSAAKSRKSETPTRSYPKRKRTTRTAP